MDDVRRLWQRIFAASRSEDLVSWQRSVGLVQGYARRWGLPVEVKIGLPGVDGLLSAA